MENKKTTGGKEFTEDRLPNKPAIELRRINPAAVPEAALTVVQRIKTIIGDKKMPPPVPVSPEIKPIIIPVKKASIGFTLFWPFALVLKKLNISCKPAINKTKPSSGR